MLSVGGEALERVVENGLVERGVGEVEDSAAVWGDGGALVVFLGGLGDNRFWILLAHWMHRLLEFLSVDVG